MVDYIRRNRQGHFKEIIGLSLAITVFSVFLNIYYDYQEWNAFSKVKKWLIENDLEFTADAFEELNLMSLEAISEIDSYKIKEIIATSRKSWNHSYDEDFPLDFYLDKLLIRINKLSKELRFQYWLMNKDLLDYKHVFNDHFVYSLEDIVANIEQLHTDTRLYFLFNELGTLNSDRNNLKNYPVSRSFLSLFWSGLVRLIKFVLLLGFLAVIIGGLGVLCIYFIVLEWSRNAWWRRRPASVNTTNYRLNHAPRTHYATGTNHTSLFIRVLSALFSTNNTRGPNHDRASTTQQENTSGGWFDRFFGNYFDPSRSVLTWSISDENAVVGDEAILKAKFYRNNGSLIKPNTLDSIRVEVIIAQIMVDSNIVHEDEEFVSIHFTPIKSGTYKLNIFADGKQVNLPNCTKVFKPGDVDPFKSSLVVPSSLLVLETCIEELLTFDERDKYGNNCILGVNDLHKYQFVISNFKTGVRITPAISFNSPEYGDTRNKAYIIINEPGLYKTDIFYNDEIFSKNIIFLVLSKNEMTEVNKNISTTNWNLWYEGYILNNISNSNNNIDISTNNSYDNSAYDNDERQPLVDQVHSPENLTDKKRKKVYCYISPKFFIVKEFWLKIFPKKLYTFRINPTVKVTMINEEIKAGVESFTVESSNGKHVKLFCQKRNILVATFVKLLLKNIGGSECFEDKKRYFYHELKKLHSIKANMRMSLKIKRNTIVEDTWRTVKSLGVSDWWKKFEISFEGELGLDYGGLAREWFHIVLNRLFNEELFQRFDKDNLQGLSHPTQFRKGVYKKLKFFELAGMLVGKCLIECACDQIRQQYVKARFTRSFLSQILGLGVSWRHFETDDKEYYTGKIKYIIDNDPEYLDIYFTEDVYDNENQLVKTVELKTNGSRILVNELNKFEYIQRLAEYRLAESVKDEINAFLKGLQSLIPDGLLTMFDENELELLLCGMEIISLADLRANHIPDYNSIFFKGIIGWFWTVISSFNQEELSRLLQFTTGCSQLPPDGFSGLRPKFKITHSGGLDTLPMAHTCFNQLCLPTYSSMKELKTKLLIAITEGVEGFGIS